MKRLRGLLLSVLAVGLFAGADAGLAADEAGKLTAEERAKAIQWMKDSHAQTLAALEGLTEAQLKFKAAPEKWSVLEVAEHISMAEGLLFGAMEQALNAKPNPDWEEKTKGKTAFLEDVMVGRKGKASAPEAIVPTGKLSRDEVVAKLKEGRARSLKFIETTDKPLKAHTLDHPFPVFGTLNAYQWLVYIPLHNFRHNKQIDEVKADPNFPRKVRPRS
ncbi:MAG: DinB family protein [Blastocatellia bacterium]